MISYRHQSKTSHHKEKSSQSNREMRDSTVNKENKITDVVIVGNNTGGLFLSLDLIRKNVKNIIINSSVHNVLAEHSANEPYLLYPRTLEIFQDLNLFSDIVSNSFKIQGISFYIEDKLVNRNNTLNTQSNNNNGLPYMLSISKKTLDGILVSRLNHLGSEIETQSYLHSIKDYSHLNKNFITAMQMKENIHVTPGLNQKKKEKEHSILYPEDQNIGTFSSLQKQIHKFSLPFFMKDTSSIQNPFSCFVKTQFEKMNSDGTQPSLRKLYTQPSLLKNRKQNIHGIVKEKKLRTQLIRKNTSFEDANDSEYVHHFKRNLIHNPNTSINSMDTLPSQDSLCSKSIISSHSSSASLSSLSNSTSEHCNVLKKSYDSYPCESKQSVMSSHDSSSSLFSDIKGSIIEPEEHCEDMTSSYEGSQPTQIKYTKRTLKSNWKNQEIMKEDTFSFSKNIQEEYTWYERKFREPRNEEEGENKESTEKKEISNIPILKRKKINYQYEKEEDPSYKYTIVNVKKKTKNNEFDSQSSLYNKKNEKEINNHLQDNEKQVAAVEKNKKFVEIDSIKTKFIIGADGRNSTIRKMLNISYEEYSKDCFEIISVNMSANLKNTIDRNQLSLIASQHGFVTCFAILLDEAYLHEEDFFYKDKHCEQIIHQRKRCANLRKEQKEYQQNHLFINNEIKIKDEKEKETTMVTIEERNPSSPKLQKSINEITEHNTATNHQIEPNLMHTVTEDTVLQNQEHVQSLVQSSILFLNEKINCGPENISQEVEPTQNDSFHIEKNIEKKIMHKYHEKSQNVNCTKLVLHPEVAYQEKELQSLTKNVSFIDNDEPFQNITEHKKEIRIKTEEGKMSESNESEQISEGTHSQTDISLNESESIDEIGETNKDPEIQLEKKENEEHMLLNTKDDDDNEEGEHTNTQNDDDDLPRPTIESNGMDINRSIHRLISRKMTEVDLDVKNNQNTHSKYSESSYFTVNGDKKELSQIAHYSRDQFTDVNSNDSIIDFNQETFMKNQNEHYNWSINICRKSTPEINHLYTLNNFTTTNPEEQKQQREKQYNEVYKLIKKIFPKANVYFLYNLHIDIHKDKVCTNFYQNDAVLIGEANCWYNPIFYLNINQTIHDIYNLSWKLKSILYDHASLLLLDSYEKERKLISNKILTLNKEKFNFLLSTPIVPSSVMSCCASTILSAPKLFTFFDQFYARTFLLYESFHTLFANSFHNNTLCPDNSISYPERANNCILKCIQSNENYQELTVSLYEYLRQNKHTLILVINISRKKEEINKNRREKLKREDSVFSIQVNSKNVNTITQFSNNGIKQGTYNYTRDHIQDLINEEPSSNCFDSKAFHKLVKVAMEAHAVLSKSEKNIWKNENNDKEYNVQETKVNSFINIVWVICDNDRKEENQNNKKGEEAHLKSFNSNVNYYIIPKELLNRINNCKFQNQIILYDFINDFQKKFKIRLSPPRNFFESNNLKSAMYIMIRPDLHISHMNYTNDDHQLNEFIAYLRKLYP